jgi:alpha-galactosidase
MFDDHHDNWDDKIHFSGTGCNIERFAMIGNWSKPGQWSDADFIMTGGQGCAADPAGYNHCPGQTEAEYRTEMALWSIMAHPLIVATEVRNLTHFQANVLLNMEIIDVNQQHTRGGSRIAVDKSCPDEPLTCGLLKHVHMRYTCQIFEREMDDGMQAVALYNAADRPQKITWNFTSATTKHHLRDLWKHQDLGMFMGSYSAIVGAHDTLIFKVT